MYPNLYYVFRDWFGVEWKALSFLNTFGLFVALAFAGAAWTLHLELRRKEKQGLLKPREEMITVGKPASMIELLINGITGFIFGYKIIGLFFEKPDTVNPQEYIFSGSGSLAGGLILGLLLAGLKWYEKNKQKLKNPENRMVRIWPHDRVGDIVVLALVFGILGAKLFDNLEHWDDFIANPIERIFSASGLAFYGGLITAAIAICWFAYRKKISVKHLVDAAAPGLMLAYAIGRIGCQVSGDGDWGIFNSAYISDPQGTVQVAGPGEFQQKLQEYASYFTEGRVQAGNQLIYTTDRTYGSLDNVPHKSFKGPSFLPNWFFAYSYPMNVNKDGIIMPGNTQEHNRVLPQPVFPTPLYETLVCGLMFLFMWAFRKRIRTPLIMFGIYLMMNGLERFFVETMRVNQTYGVLGFRLTQAEIIAILLFAGGLVLSLLARKWNQGRLTE